MQLHSAVVGRIDCSRLPSDSRGALKTLHHARLPALRYAYSARRLRARRVSPRLSRGAADPRPVRGGGGAVARLAAARHAPRRRGACRLVARPAGRPRLPHARAGVLAGALRAGRGGGGASARLPEMTRRCPEGRRSPCRRGAPRRGRAGAGAGQPPSRRPPSPRTSPPSRMPSSGRTEARRLLLLPATARCSSRRASSAGGAAGCTGR